MVRDRSNDQVPPILCVLPIDGVHCVSVLTSSSRQCQWCRTSSQRVYSGRLDVYTIVIIY